jgi:hypothetical protein
MRDTKYLGLETKDIFDDLSQGWDYIKKGGWVFVILLGSIGIFLAKDLLEMAGIKLSETLIIGIKILLS